ncbi:MAG: hypothetical protein QXI19_07270 [Candidatus Caldarchaeum sp.]
MSRREQELKMWKETFVVGLFALAWGCAPSGSPTPPSPVPDLIGQARQEYEAQRVSSPPMAGMPRQTSPHTLDQIRESIPKAFRPRNNPFALFPEEIAFETGLRYQIILGKLSGYAVEFTPPPEEVPEELQPLDVPPYRRLSGVFFGDTVSAILVMENGRGMLVTPGMEIPGTEWRVESISADELVLVRTTRRPHRQTVRLEPGPPRAPGAVQPPGGGAQPRPGAPGVGGTGGPAGVG